VKDRYTTSRIPYARPFGLPQPTAIYDGADLAPRSLRPGAYDAMRLPSVFNGRPSVPPAPPAPVPQTRPSVTARARICVWAPPVEDVAAQEEPLQAPPQLAPIVGVDGHTPRAGSLAEAVIQDLRTMPAGVAYTCDEVEAIFSVASSSVTTSLARCVEAGLIVRVKKGRRAAFALPAIQAAPSSPSHEPPALTNAA